MELGRVEPNERLESWRRTRQVSESEISSTVSHSNSNNEPKRQQSSDCCQAVQLYFGQHTHTMRPEEGTWWRGHRCDIVFSPVRAHKGKDTFAHIRSEVRHFGRGRGTKAKECNKTCGMLCRSWCEQRRVEMPGDAERGCPARLGRRRVHVGQPPESRLGLISVVSWRTGAHSLVSRLALAYFTF